MSPLFQRIVSTTRDHLSERMQKRTERDLRARIADAPPVRPLTEALSGNGFSVIAEHKRRSPSGGKMADRNVERCLAAYAEVPWISAISVLTEQANFLGDLEDIEKARSVCGSKPILRKDFIVDEYQVLEARAFGADAVLLMAAVHAEQPARLRALLSLTHELGMSALVELGMGGEEPRALKKIVPPEAEIWGINSRKFEGSIGLRALYSRYSVQLGGSDKMTDLGLHASLRSLIPRGKIAVAESGIHSARDLQAVRDGGYDAALIGTAFLKGPGTVDAMIAEFGSVFAGPISESLAAAQ